MEERFFSSFIHCYFIAFGVIIGGAIIGSIGSFATGEAPLTAMNRIAKGLRIWAIVAAIGGTFDAIANFERGLLDGSTIKKSSFKIDRKSTRLNSSHVAISYAVFFLKKKKDADNAM